MDLNNVTMSQKSSFHSTEGWQDMHFMNTEHVLTLLEWKAAQTAMLTDFVTKVIRACESMVVEGMHEWPESTDPNKSAMQQQCDQWDAGLEKSNNLKELALQESSSEDQLPPQDQVFPSAIDLTYGTYRYFKQPNEYISAEKAEINRRKSE